LRWYRWFIVLFVAFMVPACNGARSGPLVISNSTAGAYEAALDVRKGGFVAAWYDTRDGNAEIYMRLLDERGAPAGPERRLTNGPEQSYEASLKALDDGVAIAWYDKSADGTLVAKLGAWSFDGRNRWVRTLATRARNPVLARYADTLFCAWIAAGPDGREAVWGAWFDKATTDPKPILIGPVGKTTWNLNARVFDSRTAVVVYDATAGTKADELFLADVTPFGTQLRQLTGDDGMPSKYPDISGTTEQALTWFDKRDGNDEVYLMIGSRAAIREGKVTPVRVTTTSGESIGAYVAWGGSSGAERLGLAWSDNSEGQHEIYFQPFARDGRALDAARRLTSNSSSSWVPAIVPAGDGFALTWNEYVAAAAGKPASSQIAFTIVR
jgi:hypothetical protein